ncbi:glycosyltransferase [Algoriphagus aquatilis]|uniref:Glycosyltransferase n=1 Tax=Algoriphagus aquatilis TaxID=490186 RepID=A0ABW0BS28_9BACT
MRILFLIHRSQARGQEIFATQLANRLLESGNEVALVSLYAGEFDLKFKGSHFRLNLTSGVETLFPWHWQRLIEVIQEFNPELIQANGGDTVKFLSLTQSVFSFSAKLVFNNGGVVSHYLDSNWKKWVYQKLLSAWDGAISVSRYSQTDLAQLLPSTCKQTQIPIAIPAQEFLLAPRSESQVFVHIGGFTQEKNHVELIRIFGEYLKRDPKAQLWLIGDGPLKMQIQTAAQQVAPHAIRFFGAVPNPWALVPQNSILVLSSKMEGTPAVLAEAFLAKIPVVTYAVGGIKEMAEGFATIRLVEPGDHPSFIEAMTYWAHLPAEISGPALANSASKAKDRFDFGRVSNQFLEFYKDVCG